MENVEETKIDDAQNITEGVSGPKETYLRGYMDGTIPMPTQMDYSGGVEFKPLNGSQVFREVITDTYVTMEGNEDNMLEKLDDAMNVLNARKHGFAGYLSLQYARLTLFYILKNYDMCFESLNSILKGVTAVERFIMTGNYLDENGNESGFTNYAFGESDVELKQTVKFLHDAWNFSKVLHAKAASFESGFSLLVTDLMLHSYNKQLGMMRKDCENIRDLVAHIEEFLKKERDSGESATSDTEFISIEDIKTEKEDGSGQQDNG